MLTIATPVSGMPGEDGTRTRRPVVVGGDRLSADCVGRFPDRHPGICLVNAYGPVGNTIGTTPCTADVRRVVQALMGPR